MDRVGRKASNGPLEDEVRAIAACQKGDRNAYELIVKRYAARAVGVARQILRDTALARFALVNELLDKAYEKEDDGDPTDVVEETAAQAYRRAHEAVGRPWIARGTRSALMYYANNAPVKRKRDRLARQRVLRAFMLGGPDAQVM